MPLTFLIDMKKLVLMLLIFTGLSCASKKNASAGVVVPRAAVASERATLTGVSTDPEYGLTPNKPVESGGGPSGERAYLDALAGPNGETIKYYRAGSCCPVKSENGFMGTAMLDNYKVSYSGSKGEISIYINMYDKGELKAPVGFTVRK